MSDRYFSEDVAKIRRDSEVAALIKLLVRESRPFTVDLPALHLTAEYEHRVGVAVVRAAIPVLSSRATELGHGDDHDVGHAVAEIVMESSQSFSETGEQIP